MAALKGPFTHAEVGPERPFQGRKTPAPPANPGLRPGLADSAFQAE
jgi:hypothetical protein